MAEAVSLEKKEELRERFLKCSVCLDEFDEVDKKPRLLPCLHSVCDQCLKEILQNNKVKCPECRKEHTVERNFANIPFDPTRRALNDYANASMNREIICENCEDQQRATHKCRECALFLCKHCLSNHQGMRNLRKKHKVISLQLGPNEEHNVADFADQQYCKKHPGQSLSLYCCGTNCKTPICHTCFAADHNNVTIHPIKDIGDVYETEKAKLKTLARSVEDRVKDARKTRSDVRKAKDGLTSHTQKVIVAVTSSFDKCQKILEGQKKLHIGTIVEKINNELKLFEEEEQNLESYIKSFKKDKKFLTYTLSTRDKAGFLKIEPSITRKLQFLRDQSIDKQPHKTAHIEFAEGNMIPEFTKCVHMLGNVLDGSSLCVPNTVMLVPKAPLKNGNYFIKVNLFGNDMKPITLVHKDVEVSIKPPDRNVIWAVCQKIDNGCYSTPWRPQAAGLHFITSYANDRKTELRKQPVNVGVNKEERMSMSHEFQRETTVLSPQMPLTNRNDYGRSWRWADEDARQEERQPMMLTYHRETLDANYRPLSTRERYDEDRQQPYMLYSQLYQNE